MPLKLDIVTPDGVAFRYTELDRIVMRHNGRRSRSSRELIVQPHQGSLDASLPAQTLRARSGGDVIHIEIAGGVAEKHGDAVTILTDDARVIAIDRRQVCSVAS